MWSLLLPLNNPHSQDLADTSVTILNVQRPAEKHTDVDLFQHWSTVVAVEYMYPTSANNNGMVVVLVPVLALQVAGMYDEQRITWRPFVFALGKHYPGVSSWKKTRS